MLHIAICDNDPVTCQRIEKIIREYHEINSSIQIFYTGEDLIEFINKKRIMFDVLILNIYLNNMDGFKIGEKIRKNFMGYEPIIIFISNAPVYSRQLFDLRPFNHFVKPIAKDKLIRCLEDARRICSMYPDNTLEFIIDKSYHKVPYSQILYFDYYDKKLCINTICGQFIVYRKSLKDIERELSMPHTFIRIHCSYLINWDYVSIAKYEKIIMSNGTNLPISRNYRKSVKEYINGTVSKK